RAVEDLDVTLQWADEAQHRTAECRLPGAVRADDADEFPFVDLQGDILQGDHTREAERCVGEPNDGLAHDLMTMLRACVRAARHCTEAYRDRSRFPATPRAVVSGGLPAPRSRAPAPQA